MAREYPSDRIDDFVQISMDIRKERMVETLFELDRCLSKGKNWRTNLPIVLYTMYIIDSRKF